MNSLNIGRRYVVPEGNPPGIYYVEPGGNSGIHTEVIQVNGVLPTGFTKDVIVGASPFEPTAEAVESGGSQAPVDVNTTGNTAGFIPQPAPATTDPSAGGSVAAEVGIGVAEGAGEFLVGFAKDSILNALTLGAYGTYWSSRPHSHQTRALR